MNKKKVIFICTGNACRSQIAEGLFRKMSEGLFEVYSAGSHPSRLHPASVKVMNEIGIDTVSYTHLTLPTTPYV